ncbi:DUF2254 domain-containing protein [Aurantimonas sp. HBX-1]|uniref:DUF2254 domain-containing protein n=1 Tax=Aurantimonas sp. HBX-1 TaxID=2906072 RepID=UPI001F2AEBE5|nr:DUF2254 domain-containing protein [Aurantimonas sp. HBX-1]UIJ73341.1 DUF2254 domain-containing protein [Aurantimonas sp. HBX-1]
MSRLQFKTLAARLSLSLANAVWLVPVAAAGLALVAAKTLVDAKITVPNAVSMFLSTGSPVGARDLVGTIATTSLTVATFVFSISMVVLQLASSQYSPRLPGQFLRSRGTQLIIGTFIFTFVYSLAIVRVIRTGKEFVPNLAVTFAFLLILCCVLALILFIHHVVQSIRVESILAYIERKTSKAIGRTFETLGEDNEENEEKGEADAAIPEHAVPVLVEESGIVRRIDGNDLVQFARSRRLVLRLVKKLGQHVTAGTAIGWVWTEERTSRASPADEVRDELSVAIQLSGDRTLKDDVEFGFVQLVDIALRALSPAINDPTTACNALHSLGILLVKLTGFQLGDRFFFDEDDRLRVIVPQPNFTDFLDSVITPIRQAAPDDTSIALCLCSLLTDLARAARTHEHHKALCEQLERVHSAYGEGAQQAVDAERIDAAVEEVERALAGRKPRSP